MAEIGYAPRIELPYTIERGRANPISCPVYRSGVLVAPTSGTCTVSDQSGTSRSTGAVVITDSIATYTVPTLAAYSYGDGWSVTWALLMPDGIVHTFREAASVVRVDPIPVVGDADLYRRSSALDPSGAACITSLTTYQTYIDEAWTEIQRRLLQAERRVWLVVSPSELREPHLLLSLALIYEDLSTRLNAAYSEIAARYRAQFMESWSRVKLTYDVGDVGSPAPGKRSAVSPGFWMASRR